MRPPLRLLIPAGAPCLVSFGLAIFALAQQPAGEGQSAQKKAAKKAGDAPENHRPGLFFREAWKHSGTAEHPISQDSVSNPNLELKLYGEQPRPDPDFGGIWENKRPQPLDDPAHSFTGTCTKPCGLTFRDRDNFVDMTGLAKITWRVKYQGFHVMRPLIKLADGTYLAGDHNDGYSLDWHVRDITLSELKWKKLDPVKVVTLTGVTPDWVTNPDLSKIDEIGFVDLMPGSGHGNGGWSDLAWMEVWGSPVPR